MSLGNIAGAEQVALTKPDNWHKKGWQKGRELQGSGVD